MHVLPILELPTIILTDFLSTVKYTIYEHNIHEMCQVVILCYVIIIFTESDILLYLLYTEFIQ